MLILFLIVFVGLVGFGIILPLFPFYAERFGASPEVITWTMAAFTLAQAVGTPIWGRISDACGRRLVLILTMLGAAVSYALLAYADELWMVMLSRVFGGLMAGNVSTAFAYVTDITTEANRSAALGKIGAAMGLGFIFGPAIGGLMAGTEVETANYVLPALSAAALSIIATLGAMLFLPESLPVADRKPFNSSRAGAADGPDEFSLADVNRKGLVKLFVAALIFYTAMSQMESIFPLWANDSFHMGPRSIGWVFFYIGIITVIMQGGLVGPLTRKFGDRRVAIASGGFFAIGLAALAMLTSGRQVWAALLPFGIGAGLFNPTVSSLVSKACSTDERGAIMGKYQAAGALGRFFGPLWSGLMYSKISVAAPFASAAALSLPAIMFIAWYRMGPPEHVADAN